MNELLLWITTQLVVESFPVSSSGHAQLLVRFFQGRSGGSFMKFLPRYFDDLLHLPSFIVLSIFFSKRWMRLIFLLFHRFRPLVFSCIVRVALSSSMTVLLYGIVEYTNVKQIVPLSCGFFITACVLFLSRYAPIDLYTPPTLSSAFILGIVQGIALLPGISRLAMTYVTGRFLRLSPRHAFEYSFAMQVPLIIAAVIRASYYAVQSPLLGQLLNARTALTIIGASAVAYGGLGIVFAMAKRHELWKFSWYMLIPLTLSLFI